MDSSVQSRSPLQFMVFEKVGVSVKGYYKSSGFNSCGTSEVFSNFQPITKKQNFNNFSEMTNKHFFGDESFN